MSTRGIFVVLSTTCNFPRIFVFCDADKISQCRATNNGRIFIARIDFFLLLNIIEWPLCFKWSNNFSGGKPKFKSYFRI